MRSAYPVWWFQSSPSPGAGRCVASLLLFRAPRSSFNPRPARGPGAASHRRGFPPAWAVVSILAQPGGRALRITGWFGDYATRVSILAQPGGRALRGRPPQGLPPWPRFNPRPARGPGAARNRPQPSTARSAGFNPRPARGPGAASRSASAWRSLSFQSSPSPGAGRCDRDRRFDFSDQRMFQSSPSPGAGRCG